MFPVKRIFAAMLALFLLVSFSALADSKKDKGKNEDVIRPVTAEVVEEIPDTIREILDLAYEQLVEVNGKNLGKKNKYTKWRNNGEFGWCGGFITWCMLEKGVPQQEWAKTEWGEVEGIVHVKEADVTKLNTGYRRMNRITDVPQKGFLCVYGNVGEGGTGKYYHVGLVYDVVRLSESKYRITTIEGNVTGKTVRMYIRDYDRNAEKKAKNMTLVPKEEREQEESKIFSYGFAYKNRKMYITHFLMPWIPEEPQEPPESETPED